MMVIQIHHPCWEFHIVVIPCHLVKSLQATNSYFIFILIISALQLDSNWNIMQKVRRLFKVKLFTCRSIINGFALKKWPISLAWGRSRFLGIPGNLWGRRWVNSSISGAWEARKKEGFFLILACIHTSIENFEELNLGKFFDFTSTSKIYCSCFTFF